MADKPTSQQLLDEDGLKSVHRTDDGGWRHGYERTEVWHRASDDTYWQANFRISSNGETHELADGEADGTICQVKPVEKTVTVYESVRKDESITGAPGKDILTVDGVPLRS